MYGRFNADEWSMIASVRADCGAVRAKQFMQKLLKSSVHPHYEAEDSKWIVVHADYDEMIRKQFVDTTDMTDAEVKEAWEQYKEDNWANVNSPYDCSGQVFTAWMDIHRVPHGAWIYECQCVDC